MKKLIYITPIVALIVLMGIVFWSTRGSQVLGSGTEVNRSTILTSATASSTSSTTIRGGSGVLSSVAITKTSTAVTGNGIKFYDGTTSTTSATLLLELGLNETVAVVTSYNLDLVFSKGLLVDVPAGFNGSAVVTYR